MEKLVFDTLKYVKMLENGGVPQSDIHAESLSSVLSQNIYVKAEVDKMIENTFKEFAEQTRQIEKRTAEMKAEMNRIINRNTMATITILSSMMALFTFIQHLLH